MARKNNPAKNMETTGIELKSEKLFHFQGAVERLKLLHSNFYIIAMLRVRMREINQTRKKKF